MALRLQVLTVASVCGIALVVSTEALSLARALGFPGVLVAWVLVGAGIGWAGRQRLGPARDAIRRLRRASPLLVAVAALVLATGLVALLAPPNTHDAMTYHMARVAHWVENGSVAHYPTNIARQLHAGPWAEYAIAHLQILTGGDRLANLVQWASMVLSLGGVSLLTAYLGGNRWAQTLAVVVAATIPMGILQASSTQNDYALTLWLVSLAAFVLGGAPAALVGGALGLALLTKATADLFAAPLAVWFALDRLRSDGRAAWRPVALAVAVAVALNAGYYARNVATFGAPLGPGAEGPYRYVNDALGPHVLASVALRHLAGHFGTPWQGVNQATERAVAGVHRALGLDVSDSRTTWGRETFRVPALAMHEDSASNGVHLVLAALAVAAVVVRRRQPCAPYAFVLVAGFLLFSGALRWQPWHSRLELPLFVLAAPLVGLLLARWWLGVAIAWALLLLALGPLLWNHTRPLVGPYGVFRQSRSALYFASRRDLDHPYREGAATIVGLGCRHVGIVMAEFEYPLWRLMPRGTRIEHMTLGYDPRPCAVVSTVPLAWVADELARRGYRRMWGEAPVTVFAR